jgi:hypothetical protein
MRSGFRLVKAGVCAFALLAAGVGLLGMAANSVAAPGEPLLPDLVTLQFDEAYIEGEPGEKLLRFSNTVGNSGVGALEVLSRPEENPALCPDSGDRPAFQRVYRDSAVAESAGFFSRSDDREFRRRLAGCVEYHPTHLHWHFEDFARYSLRSESDGQIVARAAKVSFCIVDNGRRFLLPGAPEFQYYDVCEERTAVTGLSIGWADTYGAGLAGQHLDVSGLPDGEYCLISKADPSNRLRELRDRNNSHRSRFYLDVGNSFVDPRREQPC